MEITKKQKEILEKYFSVYDLNKNELSLEQWTNGGVDMFIVLDKNSDISLVEQLTDYINTFNIDEEIDLYREDNNYKTNFTIRESLEDLGIEEIKHYYNVFKGLSDYNIAEYGSVRVYYDDIRKMYKKAGYKTIDSFSDTKMWETYKRQVGYVARIMLDEK